MAGLPHSLHCSVYTAALTVYANKRKNQASTQGRQREVADSRRFHAQASLTELSTALLARRAAKGRTGKYDKAAQQRQEGFVLLSLFAPLLSARLDQCIPVIWRIATPEHFLEHRVGV